MTDVQYDLTERAGVEALYATGHWLHGAERWSDAAAVLRVMIQIAPADERGWLLLGDCHQQLGQAQIALELWGAGSVAAEPAPRCHLARSRVLRELGRDDAAADAYDDALAAIDVLGDEA